MYFKFYLLSCVYNMLMIVDIFMEKDIIEVFNCMLLNYLILWMCFFFNDSVFIKLGEIIFFILILRCDRKNCGLVYRRLEIVIVEVKLYLFDIFNDVLFCLYCLGELKLLVVLYYIVGDVFFLVIIVYVCRLNIFICDWFGMFDLYIFWFYYLID